MENGYVEAIRPGNARLEAALSALYARCGIRRDPFLDYTAGCFDESGQLLGTGSLYRNTLRCLAVEPEKQGEGILAALVTHLIKIALMRGEGSVFAYAKESAAPKLKELGFYEIARTPGEAAFLENRKGGFAGYCSTLPHEQAAAVVLNANPFTLGHQALVARAASENAHTRVFVVSEELSRFSFADRLAMVRAGCEKLPGVTVHKTGPYMVSAATFPTYFVKSDEEAVWAYARMDAEVFVRIAAAIGIVRRYLGEEPHSPATAIYNRVLAQRLPLSGVECAIIPRRAAGGEAISASRVRQLLEGGQWDALKALVPETTYEYLRKMEA